MENSENSTVKMEVETDQSKESEWEKFEEDFLIKQESIYNNVDNGRTTIWLEDIDSDEEDGNGQFKKKVKVENEEKAEAVDGKSGSTHCTCDCFHAKQNELLREVVHQLSLRNTLLEDFIQVQFGEKFEKFEKKRQHLLQMGFGETGKDTNGKRSQESERKRQRRSHPGKRHHPSQCQTTSFSPKDKRSTISQAFPASSSPTRNHFYVHQFQ